MREPMNDTKTAKQLTLAMPIPSMRDSPRQYTSLDDYEADLAQLRELVAVKSSDLANLARERASALSSALWAPHAAARALDLAGEFRGVADAAWSDDDDYRAWQDSIQQAEAR